MIPRRRATIKNPLNLATDSLKWTVSQFLTGGRQRLGLVAPRLLLLDEPTLALDLEITEQVEALT